MAWIEIVDEAEAVSPLAEAYRALKGQRGKVADIMKVHSLNPEAMTRHMDLYLTLMFGAPGLKRELRELIAVVVSATNGCDYCVRHHAEALNHYWQDREKIGRVIHDFEAAGLAEEAVVALEYAVKLTRGPETVNESDIATLRRAEYSDADILNLNLITSYFNFVNRIALGLGLETSAEEVGGYRY